MTLDMDKILIGIAIGYIFVTWVHSWEGTMKRRNEFLKNENEYIKKKRSKNGGRISVSGDDKPKVTFYDDSLPFQLQTEKQQLAFHTTMQDIERQAQEQRMEARRDHQRTMADLKRDHQEVEHDYFFSDGEIAHKPKPAPEAPGWTK